jgi:hypothetical protein
MNTLYEELQAKGLNAKKLSLELAWTIPYDYQTDQIIGTEIVTFKTVTQSEN